MLASASVDTGTLGYHSSATPWVLFVLWTCCFVFIVVIFGVGLAVLTTPSFGPAWLVPILCVLALAGWNVYWYGWQVPVELTLNQERLRWRAPLRSKSVLITAITGLRRGRVFRGYAFVDLAIGGHLRILRTAALPNFARALSLVLPGRPIRA